MSDLYVTSNGASTSVNYQNMINVYKNSRTNGGWKRYVPVKPPLPTPTNYTID